MQDVTLNTSLPHAADSERAVLGAILLDNDALSMISSALKPADFYEPSHRVIFQQMIQLAGQHRVIDLVTLDAELSHGGWLESAGGTAYISSLVDGVPRISHVEHYARIVQTHSLHRAIIRFGHDLMTRAYEKEEIAKLLEYTTQTVCDLSQGAFAQENAVTRLEAARRLLKSLDEIEKLRIYTGLPPLDLLTLGFLPGELVIYVAETGVGKSLFAEQTCRYACTQGHHSLFASGEMTAERVEARPLATAAKVPHWKLRVPDKLEKEELGRLLVQASKECIKCSILDGELSLRRIAWAARKMKAACGLSLIVIDYDELVEVEGRDEWEQGKNLVVGAKRLGHELQCPVILISQMRKALSGEDRRKPTLQRLYGTGAKSKHPHFVIYLDREYVSELTGDPANARIFVLKNRDGRMGQTFLPVQFNIDTLRFEAAPPPAQSSEEKEAAQADAAYQEELLDPARNKGAKD